MALATPSDSVVAGYELPAVRTACAPGDWKVRFEGLEETYHIFFCRAEWCSQLQVRFQQCGSSRDAESGTSVIKGTPEYAAFHFCIRIVPKQRAK